MKNKKKISPDFLDVVFIKKKKKSKIIKVTPREPLIDFMNNFIEKK